MEGIRGTRKLLPIVYTWLVVGLAVRQMFLFSPALDLDRGRELLALIFLGALAEWLAVPFPHGQICGGYALVLSTFMIYGPAAAVWVSGLAALFGQGVSGRENPLRTTLFNAAQYVLAVTAAAWLFGLAGGSLPAGLAANMLPAVVFTLSYMGVNHALIYLYILPGRRRLQVSAWTDTIRWDGLTYLFTTPLGFLIALVYAHQGLTGTVLSFAPVLVLQYVLRYYVRLQLANRELTAFYELAGFLEEKPGPGEVLGRLLKIAGRAVPFHSGVIYHWSAEREALLPVAVAGPYGEQFRATSVCRGEGAAGWVAQTGDPALVQDTREDPRTRQEPGLCQVLRSLMIVPVAAGQEVAALIVLGDKKPCAFDERELHVVRVLAAQTAAAVSNADLAGRVERAAGLDCLTGLTGSAAFFAHLAEACRAAAGGDRPAGLILLDVDGLRRFNDGYGRQAGDRALAELAGLLEGMTRRGDVVARYGGDEFALLLPGAHGPRLLNMAEELREEIRGHVFLQNEGRQARLTVSAGVAETPRDAADVPALLRAAQRALDRACASGGDRVAAAAREILLDPSGK